jgi:serine protease AprX
MSRRSALVSVVLVSVLATLPLAPASAAPAEPPDAPVPAGILADLDGDGVDDGLQATLTAAGPGERIDVVATFGDPSSASAARRGLPDAALRARFRLIDGFAARVTVAQARALARRPGLIRLEPNFEVRAAMEANDRDFGTQQARADYGVDGAGLEVCVVDSGVDPTHEQLNSKAPIPFLDLVNGQTTAYDDQGHGTHVASIAVGDGTGGPIASLFNGVAPAASLSSAKVLDANGIGEDSDVVLGIEWCVGRGADVINISVTSALGSDGMDAISQAVDAASSQEGIVVVAAAGNSGDLPGSVASPASARQAITVGAVAEWSAPEGEPWRSEGIYLAPFSSRGPTIDGRIKPDVVAPGVSVGAASAGSTATYEIKDGTSMASPFVAGLAALLLDRQPTWTPAQVKAAITGTAFDVGAPGVDPEWGAGVVDGLAAVASAAGSTAGVDFPAHQRFTGSVSGTGSWTQTFAVAQEDLGVPIAATVIIQNGAPVCTLPWFDGGCLLWEWSVDLEAQLIGPDGFAITSSTCGGDDECASGRQETLHTTPTAPGTYTLRVWPAAGTGGSFAVDLFTGPAGDPPPPPPSPEVHVADLDGSSVWVTATRWKATAKVLIHDETHAAVAGAKVTGTWTGGKTGSCTTGTNGRCQVSTRYGKAKASATFTVTSVSFTGHAYASGENHDPDADSDGTSVVIARP